MKYMFEELNKLTYETSQIYQLVRILILAITNDIQYQKIMKIHIILWL